MSAVTVLTQQGHPGSCGTGPPSGGHAPPDRPRVSAAQPPPAWVMFLSLRAYIACAFVSPQPICYHDLSPLRVCGLGLVAGNMRRAY